MFVLKMQLIIHYFVKKQQKKKLEIILIKIQKITNNTFITETLCLIQNYYKKTMYYKTYIKC